VHRAKTELDATEIDSADEPAGGDADARRTA
jgi:hypothetical protein